jgi:hypothetical protein
MSIPTTAPPQRHHELFCATQATALGDHAAVPPEHGARRDQPVRPQLGWQGPYQRGEDRAVGPVQPEPGVAPAEYRDFMAQDEDLGVLGR